jgi:hypothetical protein
MPSLLGRKVKRGEIWTVAGGKDYAGKSQFAWSYPNSVTFIALPSAVGHRGFATERLLQPTNP